MVENQSEVAGPECDVEGSEWILVIVRMMFNGVTVILALCMLRFIFARPELHSNTFNILFMSSFVVDILANLCRILLKYLPAIFCDHSLIRNLLGYGTPLASIINATEWYLSYGTICCGFFFNFDHLILVVFPQHYSWMCNQYSKNVMFLLTLTIPLLWVLPMLHPCCQSQFLDNTAATVFINSDIQRVYDAVDMLLESLIYVPTVFIFNCIATCVLHYRFWKCTKSKGVRPAGVLDDLGRSGLLKMPTVGWIRDQNESEEQAYLRIAVKANARRVGQVMQHRRITDEMDLSLINLIDQMIDAVGVVFYMLFWAGNNGWIQTDKHLFMSLYDASWELSTVTQPYIFLAMFPDIRREFFGYYSRSEAVERRLSAIASVEQQFNQQFENTHH